MTSLTYKKKHKTTRPQRGWGKQSHGESALLSKSFFVVVLWRTFSLFPLSRCLSPQNTLAHSLAVLILRLKTRQDKEGSRAGRRNTKKRRKREKVQTIRGYQPSNQGIVVALRPFHELPGLSSILWGRPTFWKRSKRGEKQEREGRKKKEGVS